MRILAVILCLLTVLMLFGCSGSKNYEQAVSLYYCVKDIDHQGEQKVFGTESRDAASFDGDLVALLNDYMAGPKSDKFYNPFPSGGKITGAKQEGNVLTLHLSEHFDKYPLDKLMLATACLVRTTYAHTSAPVLLLIPSGTFIDGSTYKTFTADSFLHSDQNVNYSSPE